jgi:hypothetical protein
VPDVRLRSIFYARAVHRSVAVLFPVLAIASCGSPNRNVCQPDDADGVVGGSVTFEVTVDDLGFSPSILPAQNLTNVTLNLRNAGTRPHDFVVDCMPTPNDDGCPTSSCFPPSASIAAVEPGASAATTFITPNPEGIYYFHSDIPGDAETPCAAGARGCGQFQVK